MCVGLWRRRLRAYVSSMRKPVPAKSATPVPSSSDAADVDAFLAQVAARTGPDTQGRLVMALDATASREPLWDMACSLQASMFREAASVGGLEMQLVFYRGIEECKASRWTASSGELLRMMEKVRCKAGATQIARTLSHAVREAGKGPLAALVFVGDACEENVDLVAAEAGKMALHNVPAFMFHEGRDSVAEKAFRTVAEVTRGAYCRFDSGSAAQLGALLRAVAVYAAGGRKALARHSKTAAAPVRLLVHQVMGEGGA